MELRPKARESTGRLFIFLVLLSLITTPAGSESRAGTVVRIGMLEEPKTLNIWLATDGWSRKVLGQIYQPLYIRDPKRLQMIPWLAEDQPVYDEATLSYTIKLRPARWSDGSPFTAADVAFTGNTIKEFKIPGYYSNWRFIKKVEAIDQRTVKVFLESPEAIFLSRTITTPIVHKKSWEQVIAKTKGGRNPFNALSNLKVERPIGTGPFVVQEWKKGTYLYLAKNKYFFGQGKEFEGYRLGPFVDGLLLKLYGTADTAILALRKGAIDMFWWGIQPGYLADLRQDQNMDIFSSEESSLYFLGFNLRKRPFYDVRLRHAIATLIDKDFIVKRILQGYALKMDSIVPPGNGYWHCPDLPGYGEGLSQEERIRKAWEILKEAKYSWKVPPVDPAGKIVRGEGIILPDGEPMADFTILTPPADYDPHRAMTGIMVQEWLRDVGMPAYAKPMAFGALFDQVRARHDFDLFVLGFGQLSLDPDYLRNFFHSGNDKAGGWNMSGYQNPAFDKVADESSRTMDFEKRRKLIWEMQRIIMQDIPYLPLYNPQHIEAVRSGQFEGWVQMMGGIGNLWSFCRIRPK